MVWVVLILHCSHSYWSSTDNSEVPLLPTVPAGGYSWAVWALSSAMPSAGVATILGSATAP